MKPGFYIKRLIAQGIDREDAVIKFNPKTHVIIGPSNTGKTYIFQCLKYMLGSGDLPKKIKESKGYDKCYMEIVLSDNSVHTLYRGLSGGHAYLYETTYESIEQYKKEPEILIFGTKPPSNTRSLQDYFLGLCNLQDKKVRRNKSPVLDTFNFSDLRHLSLIDEKSIIKDSSPIFTGQRGEDTKEKSIFRFLLTGRDDSNIISRPKKNIIDNRKGRLLILDELIAEYQIKLAEFTSTSDSEGLNDQLTKLEVSIRVKNETLSLLYDESRKYETTLDSFWTLWKEDESRLITIIELLSRLSLLKSHYETDILRLKSVKEASMAFSELNIGVCPICKHLFKEEHHECSTKDLENIHNAADAEIEKINTLQLELIETQKELDSESESLSIRINKNKTNHANLQEQVRRLTSERIKATVDELNSLKAKHDETTQILGFVQKIEELDNKKKTYEEEIAPPDKNVKYEELTTMTTSDFCKIVKQLLIEWRYDEDCAVSFSEDTCDLVINGQERNLSGKGYRALAHSAFTIGLMFQCFESDNAHSGVTIIDSPLCTLRSRHITKDNASSSRDVINDETKEAFYSSIAKSREQGQIIILDNDGPSAPVTLDIGYTEFTGDRHYNRFGFFPVS